MEKKTTRREDLEKARKWAVENLLTKKVYHKDLKGNRFIEFNKAGIDHLIFSKAYDLKIKLIYSCVELVKKSTLFSIEMDKKGRKDIKAVYRFVSVWENEGREYFVYIIVRETNLGKFYYDHNIIKEKP
jgi:hypothetical protein